MMDGKHVYQAISKVTAALAKEGIGKGRSNVQQGYKFRGIDDVYNALSGHLAAAQLCMLPRVVHREMLERATKSGGTSTYVVVTVDFDLVSGVDASQHTIRTMGEAMDTADKATNKAMSAAMKYACLMAFQIPTEGDNDADAHHPEKAARPKPEPLSGPALTPVLDAYITQVNEAKDKPTLMAIYARMQEDERLPEPSRTLIKAALSEKRSGLEKAA